MSYSAAIAGQIIIAVEALSERDMTPSHEVQIKAAELIGGHKVSREDDQAIVYPVQGRHDLYDVLVFVAYEPDMYVTSARCPCPATGSCSHLVAALATAQVEGYALKLGA